MTDDNLAITQGGLHVWGVSSHHLGAVPTEVLAKRSKKQFHHELDHPGMRAVSSGKIYVKTDLPRDAAGTLASIGEEILLMLERELGALRAEKVLVRIFVDQGDFTRFATSHGAAIAESMYHPKYQETSFHFSGAIRPSRVEIIYAHELTHAYMDLAYGVTSPLWFAEGMAENFSHLEWTDRGFIPTGKNVEGTLVLQLQGSIDVATLVAAGRDEIYSVDFKRWYASAWAFTRFLLERHPEDVEALLHKADMILVGLEDEYREYLSDLIGA